MFCCDNWIVRPRKSAVRWRFRGLFSPKRLLRVFSNTFRSLSQDVEMSFKTSLDSFAILSRHDLNPLKTRFQSSPERIFTLHRLALRIGMWGLLFTKQAPFAKHTFRCFKSELYWRMKIPRSIFRIWGRMPVRVGTGRDKISSCRRRSNCRK